MELRNADIAGIDIRQIDLSGVKIFSWQMEALIESLGVVVYPDN